MRAPALDRMRKLPRHPHSAFLVWLATGQSRGYIGGAFPRSSVAYGLDAIVPGRKSVSHHNARAADRLVITIMDRGRALRLARREQRAKWKRVTSIRGERVVRGPVTE